jgi:hypothetical protein
MFQNVIDQLARIALGGKVVIAGIAIVRSYLFGFTAKGQVFTAKEVAAFISQTASFMDKAIAVLSSIRSLGGMSFKYDALAGDYDRAFVSMEKPVAGLTSQAFDTMALAVSVAFNQSGLGLLACTSGRKVVVLPA